MGEWAILGHSVSAMTHVVTVRTMQYRYVHAATLWGVNACNLNTVALRLRVVEENTVRTITRRSAEQDRSPPPK